MRSSATPDQTMGSTAPERRRPRAAQPGFLSLPTTIRSFPKLSGSCSWSVRLQPQGWWLLGPRRLAKDRQV